MTHFFNLTPGTDTFTGVSNDYNAFQVDAATLQSTDTVTGGATGSFFDVVVVTAAGTIVGSQFSGVTNIEQLNLSSAGNNVSLTNGLVAGTSTGFFTVLDGGGNDTVNASAVSTKPIVFYAAAGGDTFIGGGGNDAVVIATADLTSADTIQGGAGIDNLYFSTAGTVAASAFTNVTGIEGIGLSSLGNNVTLTNTLVAGSNSGSFAVSDGAGNDAVDASGVTNGATIAFFASAGSDTFRGGNGTNGYVFTASDLTTADTVQGGSGTDNLFISTPGTLSAAAFTNVTNIEALVLANGTNNVTLTNGLVAGTSIGYFAVAGGSGNDTVDASGVTNGTAVAFFGTTGGNDTFTGGNGNDSFLFAAGGLTAADTVVGGGGNDTLWMTTAGTTATSALANVTGIEGVFMQAGGTFNLANGITSAATFAAVGSSAVDTFDATAVTGYKVTFTGNGGADVLKGGSQDDTFFIADSAFASINGNGGIDRITLTAASQSFNLTANAAKITNLEVIDLNSALNSTLTLAGTDIAQVNASGNSLYVIGDVDDTVNAGNGYTLIASGVVNNAVAPGHTFYEYQHSSGSLLFIDSAVTALTATAGIGSVSVPEGTAGGATVFNAQQSGATTYVLGGADAALFSIDGTGHISFNASPDFETPHDQGANNVYDLTVTSSNGTATPNFVETVTINVTDVNDAPVVTAGHTLNYTENQAATTIDPAITVSDVDNANLASATVQITGNYVNGQDVLGFTNQNGITGSFNSATGTLTLTGSSSVAHYQTALASVTYVNTSDNPSGAARTVTIITNDGAANSIAATDTINVTPVNDAPVVTAGHILNYTENQAATAFDPAITLSDVDSANLASATVQITGNYANGQDVLGFTNQNGITGSFNAGTGTLTLTGSSSVANYQTALASVTYVNTSDNPSGAARTVTVVTNDGALNSVAATDTINVTPVNDAPVATAGHTLAYTENQAATAIDTAITVSDADNANLASATVQITGNYVNGQDVLSFTSQNGITGSFNAGTGTLTLTGSSSVANYQTALDSVKYSNTSDDPSAATRTVTIITNDGTANGVATTDTITVQPVNDAPTLVATGNNPNYSNGVDLFSGVTTSTVEAGQTLDQLKLTVSNISGTATDSLSIDGVTVALTNGNVVATSTPGVTATVAVSGSTATVTVDSTPGLSNAAMAALVDGISYTDTNVNPGDPARVVTITQLHDTGGTTPGVDTTVLNITSTVFFDQPPVVTAGHTLNYTENQAATALDAAITVTDADNANLASATVQITGNYVNGEDVLGFINQNGISGSFNAATGTMTLTGSSSVANYQTALASITYVNTSENPSGLARTVTIVTNDGVINSVAKTDTINVTPVNDAPVVTAAHTLNYTENQAATALDPAIVVSDVDNANLASATVQITGNYVNGQDVLGFTNQNGISGVFNAGTGTMTLTGSSSVANYQTALASVTYVNTSENPSGLARTVTIITNDGAANSVAKIDTINVTPVNDAPVTSAGGTLNYTENQAATAIDGTVTVSDVDNTNLSSATVQLTTNYVNGQDILGFTTQNGITGVFNAATGTMTLGGSSSVANYQTALRSVTYFDNSETPSGLDRTVVYTVNDGALNSNSSTSTVHVTPVNDAPVVTATGTLAYTENQAAIAIAPALTVTDVDTATLTTASVVISANYVNGEDVLGFTTQNGITGSFNAATGTMTLTGSASVANYQTALESVTYTDTSENPSTAARTVTFTADDGQAANHLSAGSNHTITVASVDDAPTVTVPGAQDSVSAHTDTAITGISTNDVDAGAQAVKVSLGTTHGNITLDLSGGATLADATTNGSHSVHITGTVTQVDAALSSLVYHGDAGFTGADALTVQTNDLGHTGTGGPLSSSVATVNIGVIPKVWFIDNTASAVGADGSQGHPFNSIAAFNAVNDGGANHPQTNDYIYLKTGTGVYSETDGVHLLNGQQLIGGGDGLTFTDPLNNANTLTIETAGTRPVIDVTGGAGNDAIHLAQDNTIHGFNVATENAAATGIVDNGGTVGTLNISNMDVGVDPDGAGALSGKLGQAISITHGGVGGSMTFGTLNSGGGTTGIALGGALATSFSATGGTLSGHTVSEFSDAGGSGTVSYAGAIGDGSGLSASVSGRTAGTVTLSGNINDGADAGGGITVSGNSGGTIDFTGATKTLNTTTGNAVALSSNTGATIDFTNGGLGITTTSGTGFSASTGGTYTVTGLGNTISTTSGTALNLSNVTIGSNGVTFDSAATTSAATGISIDTVTGGAVNVNGGSIAGATTRGVDINAAQSNIAIASSIGSTGGHSVEVTNSGKVGGNTISFSGAITDTGGGINLDNNDQNTGGATVNFTGGMNIHSTTNTGFAATNGGTVNVTNGANNHLTTTTGTALNIANTTIGASNVTFHDINSNGAVNGILLNTTGSTGGLIVTGDGGASSNHSGGQILASTGVGVSLNSTSNVSLGYLDINNGATDGIHGDSVNNFTLNHANVLNNGTTSATADGLQLGEDSGTTVGVTGAVSITNSSISGSGLNNVHIRDTSGTISSLTVTGDTFNNLGTTFGANSFLFEGSGTSTLTSATFSGNTIANNNPGKGLTVQAHDTSTVGTFTVSGNTFTNNGVQADFDQDGSANLTFKFLNNGTAGSPMTGAILQAVNVFSSSQSTGGTLTGTIQNNHIGTSTLDSASTQGGGLRVEIQGHTDATVLIDSNVIQGYDSDFHGIDVEDPGPVNTSGPNVTSDVTITNNTVTPGTSTSGFPLAAIFVGADNQSGSDATAQTLRADIHGNIVPSSTVDGDFLSGQLQYFQFTGAGADGIGRLVGTAGTAAAQLAATNTGSTSASAGITVIPGPITQPPLVAAPGGVQASSPTAGETHLTQAELDSVVAAAIGQWAAAGASDAQLAALHAVTFSVDDLSGNIIGDQGPGAHITIDTDAAGHGWFVDPTPSDNSEFTHAQNAAGTDLLTDPSNAAAGHLDLLTTVTHELGHVLGLPDDTNTSDANDLMYINLVDGERRLPDASDVAQANATGAVQAEAALPVSAQAAPGTTVVTGTAGNDTIDAGHGGNILFGGASADNFVFGPSIQLNAPTPAQITHVADYSAAQGDTFDFSALTSAFHNSSVSDALVVRAVEDASGKFATLQVDHIDPMGLPSAPNWVSVAQLDGAHSGDAVNVLIDNNHSVHLAQVHVDLLV